MAVDNGINENQKYLCCDTFINVFDSIAKRPNLLKTYPFLNDEMNFISCDAEFLPLKSLSFGTVHKRSVIDHFLNPELALIEAYRVLEQNGCLIVGLYVHGGKDGKETFVQHTKEFIKLLLPYIGITKYQDHHVWHPEYIDLINLIRSCGFEIDKTYWQTDDICYIKALKKEF